MSETVRIWLPITFPTMNETLAAARTRRGSWSKYNDLKSKHTKQVELLTRSYRNKNIASAHITFEWYRKDRRQDPDNIASGAKYVLDGLVDAGVLQGDRFANIKSIRHTFHVSKEPGVWVVIQPTDKEQHDTRIPTKIRRVKPPDKLRRDHL